MGKALKWVAWISLIGSLILGVILGNKLGAEPEYSWEDKSFGWEYLLYCWVSGGISFIAWMAFSEIVEYLKNISDKMNRLAGDPDSFMPKESRFRPTNL